MRAAVGWWDIYHYIYIVLVDWQSVPTLYSVYVSNSWILLYRLAVLYVCLISCRKREKNNKITWAQEPVVRFRWYENKERKQKVQGDYRLCVLSPMMKNFYNQPFKCAPPVDKSRQGRILSVSGCASTAHTQHVHTLWSTVTIYLSWYIEIRCWCAASVCV